MISVTLMVTDLAWLSSWVYALKGSRILAGRRRVLVNKSLPRGPGNESLLDHPASHGPATYWPVRDECRRVRVSRSAQAPQVHHSLNCNDDTRSLYIGQGYVHSIYGAVPCNLPRYGKMIWCVQTRPVRVSLPQRQGAPGVSHKLHYDKLGSDAAPDHRRCSRTSPGCIQLAATESWPL